MNYVIDIEDSYPEHLDGAVLTNDDPYNDATHVVFTIEEFARYERALNDQCLAYYYGDVHPIGFIDNRGHTDIIDAARRAAALPDQPEPETSRKDTPT